MYVLPLTLINTPLTVHRSSILEFLGVLASPGSSGQVPSYTGQYIALNFVLANALFSSRGVKFRYGLDHNNMPRQVSEALFRLC
jgi:hypothetical protein